MKEDDIDFTDKDNMEKIEELLAKYPELIGQGDLSPMNKYPETRELLLKMIQGEPAMIAMPGKPKMKGKRIDWEAWYLWFNLCKLHGLRFSAKDVAGYVDKSPHTVKQKFNEIGKGWKKVNT
jgi:hypothetical protein